METLLNLFSFFSTSLITGVSISLCAALLGVILVLKRYSMMGHGLADVAFCAVSLAVTLGLSPSQHIFVTLPVVVIASFIIMSLTRKGGKGDIAIGMVSTGSLALGIIITRLGNGFNVDVTDYMFGSIVASSDYDLYMSLILVFVVLIIFIIFYNRLFLITYDESFAESAGINVTFYQFLISFLTALTIVIGMRIMGTLLISSLIIFPAVTSRRIVKSFRALIILSAAVSIVCFLCGFAVSCLLNLPTGASIVAANILVCGIVTLCTIRVNN